MDRTHAWISRSLCWPSRWVDGFFADPLRQSNGPAGSLVRITDKQTISDDGNGGGHVDVDARVWLPGAQRRLSLLFLSRDRDDDQNSNPVTRELTEPQTGDRGFRGTLRWAARQAHNSDLDFDVGLHSGLHAVTRARYRHLYPFTDPATWLRYTQRVYWQDPNGWGSRSLLELDHTVSAGRTVRFSSEVRYTEEYNEEGRGLGLFQGVNLFQRLSDRSAVSLGIATNARTRPNTVMDSYRLSLRYRRNIWRPWLFYEVEPFMLWSRDQGYQTVNGVVLRLETLFGDPAL